MGIAESSEEGNVRAMVFAAGLGTRLRPLTDLLPKPVVPLLHRPLAWYALDHLRRAGVVHAVLNTHHLGELVERELRRAPALEGLEMRFAPEPELLGTGGGVRAAVALQARAVGALGDDDLVIAFNGDIFFAPDLARAVAHHRRHDAYATMILRADPAAQRYGAIEIDEAGRVRRMLGKPDGPGDLRAMMFTGVHVLSARAVADLPERGCIVRQGYQRWLEREVIAGYVEDGPWRDLGTPREYLAANLDLLEGRVRWPGIEDPRALAIDPSAKVASDAIVETSVVGAGAVVAGGVELRRSVVWPGTAVRESATERITAGDVVVQT